MKMFAYLFDSPDRTPRLRASWRNQFGGESGVDVRCVGMTGDERRSELEDHLVMFGHTDRAAQLRGYAS